MRQLSSASGDRVHSLSAEVTTAKRKSRIQKVFIFYLGDGVGDLDIRPDYV